MKPFFKLLLKYYLKYITKLVLFIYRPTIIAVAGSTNKAFVAREIKKRLEKSGKNVWANSKSLNTEIGLPLSILRIPSGYGSYRDWLPVMGKSIRAILQKNYPDYIVLELGVSRPGDMKHLLSIVKPKISVITDITQRYLEGFSGMDDLAAEYKLLIEKTPKRGLVVLNIDNPRVKNLSRYSKAEVVTFGKNSEARWQARKINRGVTGEIVLVVYNDKSEEHVIKSFGLHNVYAMLTGLIINNYFDSPR